MMITDWDGQSAQQLCDDVAGLEALGVDMVVIRLAHNDPRLVEPAGHALRSVSQPPALVDLREPRQVEMPFS